MLRVEKKESEGASTFKLEGRFTGEGAEQVRALVTRSHTEMRLVVDLTEVMYIDSVGEEVLSLFKKLGSQFVAETSYSKDICERLDLPLARKEQSNTLSSGGSNGNGHFPADHARRR